MKKVLMIALAILMASGIMAAPAWTASITMKADVDMVGPGQVRVTDLYCRNISEIYTPENTPWFIPVLVQFGPPDYPDVNRLIKAKSGIFQMDWDTWRDGQRRFNIVFVPAELYYRLPYEATWEIMGELYKGIWIDIGPDNNLSNSDNIYIFKGYRRVENGGSYFDVVGWN